LIKIIIKEENFKWHLEAFASELFIYIRRIRCMIGQIACQSNSMRKVNYNTYPRISKHSISWANFEQEVEVCH